MADMKITRTHTTLDGYVALMATIIISASRRHVAADRLLEDRGVFHSGNRSQIACFAAECRPQTESDSQ